MNTTPEKIAAGLQVMYIQDINQIIWPYRKKIVNQMGQIKDEIIRVFKNQGYGVEYVEKDGDFCSINILVEYRGTQYCIYKITWLK